MASSEHPVLAPPKRYVTTHDASGKVVFSTALPEGAMAARSVPGMVYYEAWDTFASPISLDASERDIAQVQGIEDRGISFPQPGGVILRYCDWPPGGSAPLHRHETVDFGIVISGEIEAVLESGEARRLGPGDVLVQRNTLHAWRNASDTQPVRVVYVIMGCKPVTVAGREMKQDLGAFGS